MRIRDDPVCAVCIVAGPDQRCADGGLDQRDNMSAGYWSLSHPAAGRQLQPAALARRLPAVWSQAGMHMSWFSMSRTRMSS